MPKRWPLGLLLLLALVGAAFGYWIVSSVWNMPWAAG
ncbi:MAG: hypothetical protein QOG72_2799 [Sphingomonadales bacterium]|jgi:hypothetical protein|nr:hypothetical protein [Sphingomonadales bacterium]